MCTQLKPINPAQIILHLPSKSNSLFLVCKNGLYVINPPQSYYGRGYLLTKKVFNDPELGAEFIKKIGEGKTSLSDMCVAWVVTPSTHEIEGNANAYANIINELEEATKKVKIGKYEVNWYPVSIIDYELKRVDIEVLRTSQYYIVFDVKASEDTAVTASARAVWFETNELPDAIAIDVLKFVPTFVKTPGIFYKVRKKKLCYVTFKHVTLAPPAHVLLGLDPVEETEKVEKLDGELENLDIDVDISEEWGLEEPEMEEEEEETAEENEGEEGVVEEEEEIDVNELAMKWIKEQGLIPITLVVFDLPSEYRGAKVKIKKTDSGFEEIRALSANMGEFRTLRSLFYKELRRVAWRSTAGWVLRQVTRPNLDALNKIIEKLNKLAGLEENERIVEFLQVFMPRYYVINQLEKYIQEKKASFEEFKRKAEEVKAKKTTQYRRLVMSMREVEKLLKELQEELRYLKEEA